MSAIRLNPPKGYRPYGANAGYAPSGEIVDGLPVHWFAQCGWGPSDDNGGFGDWVMKQVGDRQAEFIFYKSHDVMDGRGDLVIGSDGKLYITGNESDSDKLPIAYEVPGYVPVSQGTLELVAVGDEAVKALLAEVNALKARIASLEAKPAPVTDLSPITKRLSAVEGVAAKANERALNALTQMANGVYVRSADLAGIVNDIIWNSGKVVDRIYAELSNAGSGLAALVKSMVGTGSGGIDQPARDIANEALTKAGDARKLAEQAVETAQDKVDLLQVADYVQATLNALWRDWVTYKDPRLLNLLWDRAVKLLRYKEKSGKTAEQLPVNDPKNLEV